MSERKKLSKKTRFEIFKRDGFACQYCGQKPPSCILEIDHVLPVASGGTDDEVNLITSCFDCNRGKSDRHLTAVIPQAAERIKNERERAEQAEAYNSFLLDQRAKQEEAIEKLGREWNDRFLEPGRFIFGESRRASIKTFLKSLTYAEILEAIEIAFDSRWPNGDDDTNTWKYFCGICWTKIRNR